MNYSSYIPQYNQVKSEALNQYLAENFKENVQPLKLNYLFDLIQDDIKQMYALDLDKAAKGALALRMHGLKYLTQYDLTQPEQVDYYKQMASQLDSTTQCVFKEKEISDNNDSGNDYILAFYALRKDYIHKFSQLLTLTNKHLKF